jgi:iron(III) transport system ATP-binding protein
VAWARCLAGNTRTIGVDEPLANLDPHLRHSMEDELRAFHDRSGVTTLLIMHDRREAMALADMMAVMEQERFLRLDTPE